MECQDGCFKLLIKAKGEQFFEEEELNWMRNISTCNHYGEQAARERMYHIILQMNHAKRHIECGVLFQCVPVRAAHESISCAGCLRRWWRVLILAASLALIHSGGYSIQRLGGASVASSTHLYMPHHDACGEPGCVINQ